MPQARCARCSAARFSIPRLLSALLITSLIATAANAQLPQTRLKALSVTGGKAGTTFDVKVSSGDDTKQLSKLVINHPGITAVPKTTKQGGKTVPVENTFSVTIKPDVPTGLYEVRVAGKYGLSNPRTFVVGRLDEVAEQEPNNDLEKANPVPLNRTINGVLAGRADIDVFKFDAKKGQTVIFDCRAARIDSRTSATLEIFNSNGRRIAYVRNAYREDPVTSLVVPSDGTYFVKVYDFTYSNGAEYFYRLSVHTGPHIDFVLPPAGLPGKTETFTLYGRNLPGGKPSPYTVDDVVLQQLDVKIAIPAERGLRAAENLQPHEAGVDAFPYVLKSPAGDSNPVPIYFAEAPVAREQEPNDDPKQAQPIQLPIEVAGQFQQEGDIDTFTFQAKAKEVFYIDVFSQRLGTMADPYLKLEQITKTKSGERVRTIQSSDDTNSPVQNAEFNISTDDPTYRFQVPADGTYRISIRDRYFESRGDPRLIYRLSIRKPTRDFRVVALPITPSRGRNQPGTDGVLALRKGENLVARVFLFRQDGFDGKVDLSVEGLPEGVTCKGASIGPKQSDTFLVFSSSEKAAEWSGLIRILAKAKVQNAAKVLLVKQRETAVEAAEKALPALRKAVQTAEAPLKKLDQQLKQAKEAVAKNPKDKSLAGKLAAVQKQHDAAAKKAKTANDAMAAGEKKLADAKTALKQAQDEKQAAVKTQTREVRPATITWSPVRNRGETVVRLARSLGLSVMNESAPFQLHSDVHRVEVNQGRQVLFPVAVARRNGFNKNVNVAVEGLPRNSNIQFNVKTIDQKSKSELYRVFISNRVKPGVYTAYLKATAQVSYRRNVEELEAAKKEQSAAAKEVAAAAKAVKDANAKLAAANKQAATDAQAVTQATSAQQTAQKNATNAQNAVKTAKAAQEQAAKALATASAAVKAANEKLEAAKKAAAAKPKDANLKKAAEAAQQEVTKAQTAENNAKTAKTQADQKVTAAETAAKKAAEALTAANTALKTAQEKAKASAADKKKAEATVKTASDRSKKATNDKRTVDRKVQQAERAARPQNININPTSTPIIIEVKPAPATLSASVPGGGNLKRGAKLDIKVTVKRTNGFKGPLTLSLPLPPDVKGLSASPVTIPADKTAGTLTVQAAGDATTGQLANMVVRATGEFDGKAAVDAAITLKVNK